MVKVKVDFSDVEDKKASIRVKPGDYHLKVKKVELKKSDNGKYISMEAVITAPPKYKGTGPIYHTCSLRPKALWNLRNTMIAMGLKAPKKILEIDLAKFKAREFGATIDDDEYEGTTRSKIQDTWEVGSRPLGKEEKSSKSSKAEKSSKKKGKSRDEDEEDEDEDEDEEEEEEDEDEDEDEEDEDEDDELEDVDL